jgi:hypothetical protein
LFLVTWCLSCAAAFGQEKPREPPLAEILQRVGRYVAAYGEQAALIVASEKYTQWVTADDGRAYQPRSLTAEFAIVKVADSIGWVGFRDVIDVNGQAVANRGDRLQRLLADVNGDASEARRISDESARYNIGPVSRNFNVPTATLFFFRPANLSRFSFKRKGIRTIDGVETVAIQFVESKRPTMVMTRAGKDVPAEGMLWVLPEDGTIVRTQVGFRGFADQTAFAQPRTAGQGQARTEGSPLGSSGTYQVPVTPAAPTAPPPTAPPPTAPAPTPPTPPASQNPPAPSGGTTTGKASASSGGGGTVASDTSPLLPQGLSPQAALAGTDSPRRLESSAEVEVTYHRDPRLGIWLPAKMTEFYEGAIPAGLVAACCPDYFVHVGQVDRGKGVRSIN